MTECPDCRRDDRLHLLRGIVAAVAFAVAFIATVLAFIWSVAR